LRSQVEVQRRQQQQLSDDVDKAETDNNGLRRENE